MKVLFLQEFVRENHMKKQYDQIKNVFFQTKGGKLLRNLIKEGLGLSKDEYYIDYAYKLVPKVIKRDKYNRAVKYKTPKQSEANEEYKYLYDRIMEEKPDIIVPTGNLGCKALINKSSITSLRGVPEEITIDPSKGCDPENSDLEPHTTWVLPTYSMEYMLANPNVQNFIETDFQTLKKFISKGEKVFEPSPVEYEFVDNIDRVVDIFTNEVYKHPVISWDLEANTLHPELEGAKPLVVTLSWEEEQGVTIPLEHKEFTWSDDNLSLIYEMIRDFVADSSILKVGHNIGFDEKFLYLTQGFTEFNNIMDTKVLYFLLIDQEEATDLSLSNMAYEFTDMGGYDKPLEDFKKEYTKRKLEEDRERINQLKADHKKDVQEEKKLAKEEGRDPDPEILNKKFPKPQPPVNEIDGSNFNYEWIPLDILHPYASGDVDSCLRIFNRLNTLGSKKGNEYLKDLYFNHYPKFTEGLAKVEANGVKMDTDYNDTLTEAYIEEEKRLVKEMRKYPSVQKLEEQHRTLYEKGLEQWALPKKDRDEDIAKLRDTYKSKLEFNPNASGDKQRVLYEILGCTLPFDKEHIVDSAMEDSIPEEEIDWYHYKANKQALEYIRDNYEGEAPELAQIMLDHSLVKTRKQGFTYKLRNMLDEKGLMHGNFNETGTACVTGDTLVLTDEGIKRIDSLSDFREENRFEDTNMKVHSHNQVESTDGFYYNGYSEGKKITLTNGVEIVTTNNHHLMNNLYVADQGQGNKKQKGYYDRVTQGIRWTRADELTRQDWIALKVGTHLYGNKTDLNYNKKDYAPYSRAKTRNATIPSKMTPELAEWLGMYMADGNLDECNDAINFILTNSKQEVLDRFRYLTKKVFDIYSHREYPEGHSTKEIFTSTHIGQWLKEFIGVPAGALNKDAPKSVLESTKEVQEAFIRGLTLDSSVQKKKYPSLYLASVSHSMMDKVRVMLMNMGIYCSTRIREADRENRHNCKEVMITYNNLERFSNNVGVVEEDKHQIITDKLNRYGGKDGRRMGTLITDEYVFVKIKEIEDTYGEFFDLHVPNSHSFIGNGVVNHNTSRISSSGPKL